jgi:hypothetical protein
MAVPDLLERLRRGDAPYGVVASFRRQIGPPGLDGVRCEMLVTDGITVETVDVELTGSDGGGYWVREAAALEAATERAAVRFPVRSRAACMAARSEYHGPIQLHRGDLPA